MRYFLLRNIETLEVYVSDDLDKQPENSLQFYPNSLKKAIFDKYPNPFMLQEGYIEEENLVEQTDQNEE